MISELIVSKIILEGVKCILQKEFEKENIQSYTSLRIISSLSDLTTAGIICWAYDYFTDISMNNQIEFEKRMKN